MPAPAGEDEPIWAHESAVDYVQRTAATKLQHALVWRKTQPLLQQDWAILCADTTVELDGEILGKPKDMAHAAQILQRLSGRKHQVHTASALAYNNQLFQALSSSHIQFKDLSALEISQYCQSLEPQGKAGAYGIQGRAATFIKHIQGSYSSVMGLDLYQTHQLCLQAGLEQTTVTL